MLRASDQHPICEDLRLQPLASVAALAEFNPLNKVQLREWLVHEATAEDQDRMHCLGNIAVPQCGSLAAEVLVRMLHTVKV